MRNQPAPTSRRLPVLSLRRAHTVVVPLAAAIVLAGCSGRDDASTLAPAVPLKPAIDSESSASPREEEVQERRRVRAFVALEESAAVAVVEGPPWRLVRRVPVAAGPHNVEASPNRNVVAVTSPGSDRVTLLTRQGLVVAVARISGYPHDIAFTSDGRSLWVAAERGRRVVKLSVATGRLVRSASTNGRPHNLAVSPDGEELWVTIDGSSRLEIRSARTGRLLARPDLGGAPHDLAFSPDGRTVWLSNWSSGQLTVASVASRQPLGRLRAGDEPHHFAFGLGSLWASDNGGAALLRIGPGIRRVLGRTPIGEEPHHVAVVGRRVLVALHGSGEIAVVSRGGELKQRVPVGAGPHGIAGIVISEG